MSKMVSPVERDLYARASRAVRAMLRALARDIPYLHDEITNEALFRAHTRNPAMPPLLAKKIAKNLVTDFRRRRSVTQNKIAPGSETESPSYGLRPDDWLVLLARATRPDRGASRLAYQEGKPPRVVDPYETDEERAQAAEDDRLYELRRAAREAQEAERERARRATPPGRVRPLPLEMTDAPDDGGARDWRDIWQAMRPLTAAEHAAREEADRREWEEGLVDTREIAWLVERDPEWVQRALRAEGITHQRGRVIAVHLADLHRVWPEVQGAVAFWAALEETAERGPGFDYRSVGNPNRGSNRFPRRTLWLDVRELAAVTSSSTEAVTRALDRAGIALRRGRSVVVAQEMFRDWLDSIGLGPQAGKIVRAVKESRRVRRA